METWPESYQKDVSKRCVCVCVCVCARSGSDQSVCQFSQYKELGRVPGKHFKPTGPAKNTV